MKHALHISALLFFTICAHAAQQRKLVLQKPSSIHNNDQQSLHIKHTVEEPKCCGLSYKNAKLLARLSCPAGALITAVGVVKYFEGHPYFGDESAWQIFNLPLKSFTPSDDPREREAFLTKTCIRLCLLCPHAATLSGGYFTYMCLDSCTEQCFKGPKIAKMEE